MGDDIGYWLALGRIKGLERVGTIELAKELGGAGALFEACRGGDVKGLGEKAQKAIRAFDDWSWCDTELEKVERYGARLVTLFDPEYPALLKEIPDPPYLLYAKGLEGVLPEAAHVAVVGTRRPTHYGSQMSEGVSRDLAYMGAVVVSGLARGCDSSAHRGALKAGGLTVAVLGTGLDVVYPKENQALYDEIAEKGVVFSELPMGTGPAPYNFPKRNRIISGMSDAVLVVEAPLRSGALMTARLALDYNREVMAVPGPATSYKSKGANRLLKEGAALIECADDIAAVFSASAGAAAIPEAKAADKPRKAPGPPAGTNDEEKKVLRALGPDALHIDAIIEKTGFSVVKTSTLLLDMELKGLIIQRPGKCFIKRI